MDRTERFYRIEQLLHERTSVPVETFLDELGISIATFKRDLDYLRDRFHAPIVWDRMSRGYRFDDANGQAGGIAHELPGLWFSASEVHALLTMRHLLAEVQPGLLDQHVQPLLTRLNAILGSADHAPETVERRVRILHAARRSVDTRLFPEIAQALLKRRRLLITHFNRQTRESLSREISPQRLVHYRDNWYLDAWCHLRQAIRSFAVDVIESVITLPTAAEDIDEQQLEDELASGYGIFSGKDVQWALIRFSPERARWVQSEQWHPGQTGYVDENSHYWLKLPYSQPQELIMDILRHGDQAEVIEPELLRTQVADLIRSMLANYQK
jgi:predicted DNA-binding transcriptional regulator YafY